MPAKLPCLPALPCCSDDVEEGGALPASSSLLEGVVGEGDTELHAVAAYGRGESFLRRADIIHGKAGHFLFKQNKEGDTPVHCAARAGNLEMVSRLIHLAKLGEEDMNASADPVKSLLEKENTLKETALHEAVRIGRVDIVELLMKEDQDLASFPRTGGTSPLYLAILLKNKDIVDKLYEMSGGGTRLSYSGPNGQNALHAAATRGRAFTERLLKCNTALSAEKDETGSMPLHFAAAKSPNSSYSTQFHDDLHEWRKSHSTIATQMRKKLVSLLGMAGWPRVCLKLLEANPAALYEPDHHGSYPIHIATSVGATRKVLLFLYKHPSSAGLLDARGRTFLHVAVEKMAVGILYHATRDKSLAWILNMRDKDGNTAMHLAVQGGRLRTFCRLLGNRKILLNLPNAEGKTCLDLACYNVPPGLYYSQNSEACIRRALAMVGALCGTSREDHFGENYERNHRLKLEEENREAERMKDATQTLSIGSVLIATVTFGATFSLPGGYKADDHPNGGSPTLAGTYAFDAFMMANTLAFICASMATIGFMFSGTPMVNRRSRKFHLRSSVYFMEASVTSLTAAFALGVYMVLAPVAYKTAVAVCAVSPFALLWKNVDYWKRWLRFAGPFWVRKGLFWTLQEFVRQFAWYILLELWPLVIIFCWAAFANTSTHL